MLQATISHAPHRARSAHETAAGASTISIIKNDNRAQWLNTSRGIGQGIKFSTPLADNVVA